MNKYTLFLSTILIALFMTGCQNNSIKTFEFDINLYDSYNSNLNNKDILKDSYIINFWFPSCAPCAKELPHFQKLYELYKHELDIVGIQMIGIDNANEGKDFAKKFKLTYKLGYNDDNKTIRKYNINSFPTTFFVNKNINEIIVWDGYIPYDELLKHTKEMINMEIK